MGEHIDNRKYGKRNKKLKEGSGDPSVRAQRVSFKHYLRDLEEELLDEELETDDKLIDPTVDE